ANRTLRDADVLATRAMREILAIVGQRLGGGAGAALRLGQIEVSLAVAIVGGLLEIQDRHGRLAGADVIVAEAGLRFRALRLLLERIVESGAGLGVLTLLEQLVALLD